MSHTHTLVRTGNADREHQRESVISTEIHARPGRLRRLQEIRTCLIGSLQGLGQKMDRTRSGQVECGTSNAIAFVAVTEGTKGLARSIEMSGPTAPQPCGPGKSWALIGACRCRVVIMIGRHAKRMVPGFERSLYLDRSPSTGTAEPCISDKSKLTSRWATTGCRNGRSICNS
jgi:hypothetical protein